MSDTDDTDFLLFIPPNFFNVSSPECSSPVDRLLYVGEDLAINRRDSVHHAVNAFKSLKTLDMENTYVPLLNSVNGTLPHFAYTSGVGRQNGVVSTKASELSPLNDRIEKNKSIAFNTWPTKTNELANVAKDESKYPPVPDDLSVSKGKPAETSPNKLTRDGKHSNVNLSQVDLLLIEMEKTRAEIKNKLQSNKNKIYEMRRECSGNNTDVNVNQERDIFKDQIESIRSSEFAKPAADVLKRNDSNPLTNNLTKNQTSCDVDFALLGKSKNMLQLSQIMSSENNVETLQQKLEAEILKKKHCEDIIHELQQKILEQQQNLNVAQNIDAEKEEIIKQLQNAWLQLVEHWKELEHQRQELAVMLEQERVETRNLNLNFNQKIEMLESRLHETISLASGYRGRNEELEKMLKQTQESLTEFEDNFRKSEEYAKLMELEKSNLLEQLRQTNESLTAEKQKNLSSQTNITDLENQVSVLLSEKNELTAILREEKNVVTNLRNEIIKLKEDYNRVSCAESLAIQQMSTMKQEILRAKNNLKEFYQNQLDTLLRKKIEEFQKEFQKTQTIMRQELNLQERAAEERLQAELKQLQDSHKMELSEERRMNQKHVNILKTELRESRKKIYELENRLKSDSTSKAQLAKRVQSVLKSQWLEALSVISGNDDLSKDFLTLNLNGKNTGDIPPHDNEEESSDFEIASNKSQKVPMDLRNYISVLLDKEPGNPVDDYRNLEFLLSNHKIESSDKKSSEAAKNFDNFRKKPPWK